MASFFVSRETLFRFESAGTATQLPTDEFLCILLFGCYSQNEEMIDDDGVIISTEKCCLLATLFCNTFQRSVWFESERNFIYETDNYHH